MADFLTIAGIVIGVDADGARERPRERGGEKVRAFAGNLRSSIRWEKRGWDVTTWIMTQAEVTTLRAAVLLGTYVTCAGDALGASILCDVEIQDAAYEIEGETGFWRVLNISITEV